MPKLIAVIGVLVMCAGLDLLWQSRGEIRYWLSAFGKFFQALMERRKPPQVIPSRESHEKRQSAFRFMLGIGFALLVGPILLALSLTLFFSSNLQ